MAPGAPRDGLLPGHQDLPDQLPHASDGDAGGPSARQQRGNALQGNLRRADHHPAGCTEAVPGSALEAGGPTPTVGDGGCQGQLAVQCQEVPASEAYPLHAKLHYSHETILALGCTPPPGASGPEGGSAPIKGDNPRERVANNMDVGIQQLDQGSEVLPPPAAPPNVAPRYPRLTASNVTSIVGKDWRKKHYPGAHKDRHFFLVEAEGGLILPSISAWEVVTKGATKGGYMWYCQGFWKASRGGSRFLQITGEHPSSWCWMSHRRRSTTSGSRSAWSSTSGWSPARPPGMSALSWRAR